MKQSPRIVVGVLLYNHEGKVFLAKSPKWQGKWTIPGGHVEWGETLQHAAAREVKEETNIDVTDLKFLNVQESIFSEEYHETKHMVFFDFAAKAAHEKVVLNEEFSEYRWIYPREALQSLVLNTSTRKLLELVREKNLWL